MNRGFFLALSLLVLIVCSGCAAPVGTRYYPGGFGVHRPPEISDQDMVAAINGIRFHGVRILHGRAAIKLYYTPPLRWRHIDYRRPPTMPRWSFTPRISEREEPLGRLEMPAEAPN